MYFLLLFLSCHIQLFETPWTVGQQVPLSTGFFRQEYWNGLPFPPPGDLPDPGIKPSSLVSPALAGGFFTAELLGRLPLDSTLVLMVWFLTCCCSENDFLSVCVCACTCAHMCLHAVVDWANKLCASWRQVLTLLFLWYCAEVPAVTFYQGENSNEVDQCIWHFLEIEL